MTDYSFIRLLDSFEKAKDLRESPLAKNSYYEQVHLLPFNETYLQISNTPNGISFQSDYTASLVNCNNDVLLDVTNHVLISEFTSSTGLQQIKLEIVNLPQDFAYETLFLRIESNTNSEYAFWSSPFVCTQLDKEYTSRYDYWSLSDYKGIDYTVSQAKQSIRLNTYFNQPIDENEVEQYYRITTSQTVASRSLLKEFDQYIVNQFNGYFLRRLNVLLTHQNVYIDCERAKYSTSLEFTERIELSNIIDTTFIVDKDESDIFEFSYQVYQGLQVNSFDPDSSYTVGNVPEFGVITFNQSIEVENGEIRLYADDSELLNTWNETELTQPNNSSIQINDNLNIYANIQRGYYFQIDNTLIKSLSGEFYQGINDSSTWNFAIQAGEYNNDEYNTDEYVTDQPTPTPTSIFNSIFNNTYS